MEHVHVTCIWSPLTAVIRRRFRLSSETRDVSPSFPPSFFLFHQWKKIMKNISSHEERDVFWFSKSFFKKKKKKVFHKSCRWRLCRSVSETRVYAFHILIFLFLRRLLPVLSHRGPTARFLAMGLVPLTDSSWVFETHKALIVKNIIIISSYKHNSVWLYEPSARASQTAESLRSASRCEGAEPRTESAFTGIHGSCLMIISHFAGLNSIFILEWRT